MAPRQAPRAPPAKRRKTTTQIEELKFDPEARNEWLTGFRKRKQQRIKHAQEQSAKIEKEEKVKARKEVCNTAPPHLLSLLDKQNANIRVTSCAIREK